MRVRSVLRSRRGRRPVRQVLLNQPLRIASYISAHGLGHAVRASAVLERLAERVPLRITVLAACRQSIWPASLAAATQDWIAEPSDAGVIQSDDVTVDLAATAVALDRWVESLPAIVERERKRLVGGFDLVLGDVPSPVFEAAKLARLPSVAVANFSWDWIYGELGFAAAAAAAARGYASADLLLRATPFGPMPAFARLTDVGIVARPPSGARREVRRSLGIADGQSAVLLAFQPASAPSLSFPPPKAERCFLLPQGWTEAPPARTDIRELPPSVGFVAAMAASDVVVGKPGYGLISDVEASGSRFLYVPRPGFPENAVLEQHLSSRAGTAAVAADELATPAWWRHLERIESSERPQRARADGASRAADEILRLLSIDSGPGAN